MSLAAFYENSLQKEEFSHAYHRFFTSADYTKQYKNSIRVYP